jgi:SAM-dependent methyltransferase
MEKGSTGFSEQYWKTNYSEPATMDGIGNAKEHCRYLKALLALDHIDISSIIDFGCGTGHLFKEMLKTFIPYKAMALEPSPSAYQKLKQKNLIPVESTNLQIHQVDISNWCHQKRFNKKRFDLGLCTSVLQYMTKKEIEECLPIMAQRVKYLYLTVPTDIELIKQVEELDFKDPYAKSRTRAWYQKVLSRSFTFIGARVYESKYHFNEQNSHFSDQLFRY